MSCARSTVAALTAFAVLAVSPVALAAPPDESAEAPAEGGDDEAVPPEGEAAPEPEPEPPAEASPEDQAKDAYAKGVDAYNNAEFQTALEHFQDALTLHPSANFYYNIGLCYQELGKLDQAIDAYNAYLRSDPEDSVRVEKRVAQLEKRIAAEAEANEEGPQPATSDPIDGSTEKKGAKPGVVLIGVGAALTVVGAGVAGVGGTVFGLQGQSAADDVFAVYEDGNPDDLTAAETEARHDDGRSANVGQIVTLAGGGVIAAAGIALLALGIIKKKKSASKTAIAPNVGPGQAGLAISGRF